MLGPLNVFLKRKKNEHSCLTEGSKFIANTQHYDVNIRRIHFQVECENKNLAKAKHGARERELIRSVFIQDLDIDHV